MEKTRKMSSDDEFMAFGYRVFFWTFSWKNPDKNDIGGLIHDIWVSSFFGHFHGKNPDEK